MGLMKVARKIIIWAEASGDFQRQAQDKYLA